MKKLILTFIIGFATLLTASAQEVKIGIMGGLNRSRIWHNLHKVSVIDGGSNTERMHYKNGINIGAVANIPLSHKFILQPGLLYSQKGFKGKGGFWLSNSEYHTYTDWINTNYVDIPLYLKFRFKSNVDSPYIVGGPGIGGRLNFSHYRITRTKDASGQTETRSYYSRTKISESGPFKRRLEAHVSLGAGIEKSFGKHQLAFESRYTLGLTNLLGFLDDKIFSYNHFLSVQAIYFIPTSLIK